MGRARYDWETIFADATKRALTAPDVERTYGVRRRTVALAARRLGVKLRNGREQERPRVLYDCASVPKGAVAIPLTRGQVALVDEGDAEWVAQQRWHADFEGYAATSTWDGQRHKLRLHVAIMRPPEGHEVDHINRNRLDNRRSNLRLATHAQQADNSTKRKSKSGLKGAHNNQGHWRARITHRGVEHHLGYFPTPESAHEAYKEAAARLKGEFARFE